MSKRSLVLLMFKKIILAAIIIFILIGPQLVLADQPTITLTEIMSNPEGADTNREWIEIYNYGNEPVVISGGQASTSWRFKDSGSHLLNLGTSTITLAPGALAILASNDQTFLAEHQNFNGAVIDTTMSLTNSGGEVSLSNNNGQSWFEVVSYATTTEGYSWEKITPTADNQNSNWRQSLVASGSPGQLSPPAPANEVVVVNQASSTPGQEVIVVESATTSDSVAPPPAATTTQAAEVNNQEVVAVQIVSQSGGGSVPAAPAEQKIVISDLLPNPTGADEKGEFIELYNPNLMAIDLDGWKLQDQSPAMFTIEETKVSSTIIGPISYWVVYRPQSKLVLNNASADGARLYNVKGDLIDSVEYQEAEEGQSYSLVSGQWLWQAPTPLGPNKSQAVEANTSSLMIAATPSLAKVNQKIKFSSQINGSFKPTKYQWQFGDGQNGDEEKESHTYATVGSYLINLIATDQLGQSLSATTSVSVVFSSKDLLAKVATAKSESSDQLVVDDFETLTTADSKQEIWLRAAVVVPTGVTKKNQLWLGEYDGNNEQISLDNLLSLIVPTKTELASGQIVSLPIKVSHLASGLKLRLVGEPEVLDQITLSRPVEISLGILGEELVNSLVTVSGTLIKNNQKSFVIGDDEGEIKIISTLGKDKSKLSSKVLVSGLLMSTGGNLVIYPTQLEWLAASSTTSTIQISVGSGVTTTVPSASNKQPTYLIGGASALLGLGWLLLKLKGVA